jgi:hypothetical protein
MTNSFHFYFIFGRQNGNFSPKKQTLLHFSLATLCFTIFQLPLLQTLIDIFFFNFLPLFFGSFGGGGGRGDTSKK